MGGNLQWEIELEKYSIPENVRKMINSGYSIPENVRKMINSGLKETTVLNHGEKLELSSLK